MATKSIAWNTGSGNITLTYQGQGDGPVSVQSDANNGAARSQVITIETTAGSPVVTKNLTISQAACPIPVGTILTYDYTGTVQEVTLPAGTYKIQCWGAQGGSVSGSYTAIGAKGGYSEGTLTLSIPTTVYIFVGGQGSSASTSTTSGIANGGWNGGGGASRYSSYSSGGTDGRSYPRPGGGATDISTVTSDMSYSSYRNNRSVASLNARLIVAGGGAGASARYTSTTSTVSVSGTLKSNYFIGTISHQALVSMSLYGSQTGFFNGDGSIGTSSSFTIRKYRVTAGKNYYFSTKFGSTADPLCVGWYNSSGNFISAEPYSGTWGQATTFTNQQVTAPAGAYYLYLNTQNSQNYYDLKQYETVIDGIGERSSSSFKYYRFPVTAGQTYDVVVSPINNSDTDYSPIVYGGSMSGGIISNASYYSWNTPRQGFNGSITIPSGKSYLYITVDSTDTAPTVSYTTTSTSSGTSNGTQVGGGTSGGGTNPGTQSGGGGELGKGANMTQTGYRYCSGGGGGGYYGGGSSYSDSSTSQINSSGGGSGYVGSLTNAQTKAGNTSFPNTAGTGNETGHSGNGYAKITRLS